MSNFYDVTLSIGEDYVNATVAAQPRTARLDSAVHGLVDALEADLRDRTGYPESEAVRAVQYIADVVTTEDVPRT